MSEFTIHLRSDNPALLVEFNLPPGTHARIGAALDAEVSIPLAGLADYAGLIGRNPEGRLYLADANGENERLIALPAAFPLPPYHFVVFHPEKPVATVVLAVAPARQKFPTPRQIFATAAVLAVSALIILNRPNKPATVHTLAPLATTAPAPRAQPEKPASDPPAAPTSAAPAVVEIKAETSPAAPKFDLEALAQRIAPAVFRLEVKDAEGKTISTGTAFAISADGLAVTNFHVVDGGKSFTARTTQGAEFVVNSVPAIDPAADLALITLKASNLPFLDLGESDSLRIEARVAVFGAPRGLSGTLSDGILSARRTEEENTESNPTNGGRLLQISAPVSSGSSGSPVFDSAGKVIGVAVSVLSGPTSQNLNFAVPVEAVQKLKKAFSLGTADTMASFNFKRAAPTIKPPEPAESPEVAFFDDPDYPQLRQSAAAKDWIQSLKIGKQIAARHPKSAVACLSVGISLHQLGLGEQALSSFQSALAIEPENSNAWKYLGIVHESLKNNTSARESWKRAGGIKPDDSDIWMNLARSYLRTEEYLDAIAPMENLRKLDRSQFEAWLAEARSIRAHPPQLQAMLHHFDNMADGATSVAAVTAPTDPEKLAEKLVASFLRHGQGPDIRAEMADYAATVNPYFDQGQQTKAGILKDITAYRAKWPRRSLQLLAVESARRDDADTLEATYRLRYSASDGKKTRAGTLIQGIRYTLTNGRWLVSGIQTIERVVE